MLLIMSVLSAVILVFFGGGWFWVCNQGSRRYYIQSAFRMSDDVKRQQEIASLLKVDDSFKKIIVTYDDALVHHDSHGITTMGILDFLLAPNSLEL